MSPLTEQIWVKSNLMKNQSEMISSWPRSCQITRPLCSILFYREQIPTTILSSTEIPTNTDLLSQIDQPNFLFHHLGAAPFISQEFMRLLSEGALTSVATLKKQMLQ